MLGAITPHRFLCGKYELFACKPFTPEQCDPEIAFLLLKVKAALHQCPVMRGVGTGKKRTSYFFDTLPRYLLWVCTEKGIPERCARRVRDLTSRIVREYAYPSAYGGFSDVWSCMLRHEQSPPERVAVKAIRPILGDEEFELKEKAVQQELDVWLELRHRNVMPLYGMTYGFGLLPAFVSPWADNGTLSEYLEKFGTQLDMGKRLKLLSDVADGLDYLHSRNIMHGDLSGTNILITKSGRARLSDFGLSTLFEQVSDTVASGICFPGNIRWAAPELLDYCQEGTPQSQSSSQQADIYSFGCIMLQILSGKQPFHEIRRVAQIVIMISRGSQPPREPGWDGRAIPDTLWEFVQACWARPNKRPSSEQIVRFIKQQMSHM